MDIPANLLPAVFLWSGSAVYLLLLCLALLTAPWSKIRDAEAMHVFFGAVVMITAVWIMRGGIHAGLGFHLLGMTLLCLMFEWQFALFAASLVIIFTTWRGPAGWAAIGVNALLMGALPILFTRVFLYVVQRRLPHHFFIYLFVNAFLAGALSILLTSVASGLLQYLADTQRGGNIGTDFLQVVPMLMFGEGFLNGATMAVLVTYRPQWVATFHDRWYLQHK